MEKNRITQLGDELYEALTGNAMLAPLTEREPGITIDDAYAIQQQLLSRRLAGGARVVGKKVGVTSRAVMNMLEVFQPDFGYLLDDMLYNDGDSIPRDSLIQPRAEGEIAFVLKHDLNGPGISAADVLRATDFVMPCFEIVDSRIRDWKIRIQDTVADNASCGVFVLGNGAADPRKLDLATCGMVLEKNGEIVATGAGAAALGNPVNAVAWLANTMGRLGVPLRAGEVILSGALAAMFPAAAGDHFRVTIGGLGTCGLRFH
jgi:2-oxopent-4-enoate/cis-2-oxohex-4-enoate hydratase